MINTNRISAIIVIAATVLMPLVGCKKSNDPAASMSASINGASFYALGARVTTSGSQGIMTTVTGTNMPIAGSTIATSFTINVLNKTGTYSFGHTGENMEVTAYLMADATGGKTLEATAGSVTVTSSTAHYFQGTYTFTFHDSAATYTVTSGQFTGLY